MQIKGDEMNILVEALPYLSAFKGKTVVVHRETSNRE